MQHGTKANLYTIIAGALVLALCLSAVVASRLMAYDPAASADSDTILDYLVLAGMWLTPVAAVILAKSIFAVRRFGFAISWITGFLVSFGLLAYEIFFPNTPPEGDYGTKTGTCIGLAIFIAIVTGLINFFDSLIDRQLCKCKASLSRNWLFCFVGRFVGTCLLSAWVLWLVFGFLLNR